MKTVEDLERRRSVEKSMQTLLGEQRSHIIFRGDPSLAAMFLFDPPAGIQPDIDELSCSYPAVVSGGFFNWREHSSPSAQYC